MIASKLSAWLSIKAFTSCCLCSEFNNAERDPEGLLAHLFFVQRFAISILLYISKQASKQCSVP